MNVEYAELKEYMSLLRDVNPQILDIWRQGRVQATFESKGVHKSELDSRIGGQALY